MYATASLAERMSGSDTISISGVPARFRSMADISGMPLMQTLAGILLEMRARDTHALDGAVFLHHVEVALRDDGQLVLADLVALGKIGVEVVLACEHGAPRDLGIDGQPELHGHAHRLAVEHGQHARIAQVHQIGLRVGLGAIGRGRAGEDLGLRGQLCVDLQADDCFPLALLCAAHAKPSANPPGVFRCQSVSCW